MPLEADDEIAKVTERVTEKKILDELYEIHKVYDVESNIEFEKADDIDRFKICVWNGQMQPLSDVEIIPAP